MYLFSGKISNAFIRYFQQEGKDIYPLLREVKVSEELLCNPDYWIDSENMEKLLSQACSLFKNQNEQKNNPFDKESLLEKVGYQTPFLKAWGALDWALRIIEDPWDTFQNPEMFLSYFISPKPKIHQLQHRENSLSFVLPFQGKDYPHTSSYLKAAIASLPCYRDKNRATVKWEGHELTIEKTPQEDSLFTSQAKGSYFNPSVISSLFESLQQTQKYLHKLQQNQKSLLPQEEKEGFFTHTEENEPPKSYELIQNSLHFFKEYLSRKKIKAYQNAFLCDKKAPIHFPQQLQICFHLLFSLILSFTEKEGTIYINHSYMKQKGMEVKISFKNRLPKLSQEKGILSHMEAIEQILTFTLKREGAHMEMDTKGTNQSISFYFPISKEHWIN